MVIFLFTGNFDWQDNDGSIWHNSEDEISSIREVTAQTKERCKNHCVRARAGSDICVGYSYNLQERKCYLKRDGDARKLVPSNLFVSARIAIGKSICQIISLCLMLKIVPLICIGSLNTIFQVENNIKILLYKSTTHS